MIRVYTCYHCGFPFKADENNVIPECPSCSYPASQYLSEPFTGNISDRRIHVDFPKPDPNWDPMDYRYHPVKDFPKKTWHGRLRRFVIGYDNVKELRKFYKEVMDWDIVPTEHSDPENPLLYCATGPGYKNWEPRVPSFTYGYMRARATDDTGLDPSVMRIMLQVDNIEQTLEKAVVYGGKVIKERFQVENFEYALILDSEGNPVYIWQTPDDVDFENPDTQIQRTEAVYKRRAPLKYPRKSLHGRCRTVGIVYDDQERIRRFYINVFGWECFRLPKGVIFANTNNETPTFYCATGPAQNDWEGIVPGYCNCIMVNRTATTDKPFLRLETEMDIPFSLTLQKVVEYGGKILSGREDGSDWANSALCEDPQGNRLVLTQCPDSRTWEEPEAEYDTEASDEERYEMPIAYRK